METGKLKLSSPWEYYGQQVNALFQGDPNVSVICELDGEDKRITLYVCGTSKADALAQLLPSEVVFGNIKVKIIVKPSNEGGNVRAWIVAAFSSNPYFVEATHIEPSNLSPGGDYALFAPEAVQFWADNLFNPNGLVTQTIEDLVKDVFVDNTKFVCTSVPKI